jgi:hypothetical protein
MALAAICVSAVAMADGPVSTAKAPGNPTSSPATAPAEDRPAKVLSVSGRAQKLLAGQGQDKWQDLVAGDLLDKHTVIRTGLRSRVVLKFQDRAEVIIEDATKIGISEFLQAGPQVQAKIGLKYGSIHVDVPKDNGPTDFSVSTPVATLSIRGTAGAIDFSSDTGLHLSSERGVWRAVSGRHHRDVGAGQSTTGTLTPHLELVQTNRSTSLGDFFGGTDSAERNFLQNNGNTGRGVIIITGSSSTNTQTTPTGNSTSPPKIEVPGGDIDIGGGTPSVGVAKPVQTKTPAPAKKQ